MDENYIHNDTMLALKDICNDEVTWPIWVHVPHQLNQMPFVNLLPFYKPHWVEVASQCGKDEHVTLS